MVELSGRGLTGFLFRSRDVCRRQFFSVDSDLVLINIGALCVRIGVRILSPAFDREKKFLLHFRPRVVHPVIHLHGRVIRMQINFQLFVLNRDLGFAILVGGACTTGSRNAGLPGAAIG